MKREREVEVGAVIPRCHGDMTDMNSGQLFKVTYSSGEVVFEVFDGRVGGDFYFMHVRDDGAIAYIKVCQRSLSFKKGSKLGLIVPDKYWSRGIYPDEIAYPVKMDLVSRARRQRDDV
jgi:hypothetical protein